MFHWTVLVINHVLSELTRAMAQNDLNCTSKPDLFSLLVTRAHTEIWIHTSLLVYDPVRKGPSLLWLQYSVSFLCFPSLCITKE